MDIISDDRKKDTRSASGSSSSSEHSSLLTASTFWFTFSYNIIAYQNETDSIGTAALDFQVVNLSSECNFHF
jgi:hypothetical protein